MLNGPHHEWLTPHDSVSSTILMFHHFFRYMEGMSGPFRSGIPWNSTNGAQASSATTGNHQWLGPVTIFWDTQKIEKCPKYIQYKLWYCWYPPVSLKIHENTPQKKKHRIQELGMSNDSKVRAKSPSTFNPIFQWFHVRFQCFDYLIHRPIIPVWLK